MQSSIQKPQGLLEKTIAYGRMIRFSHSIFALPFALTAVVFASMNSPLKISTFVWILVSMVSARSAAMGFNRLVDRKIDAKNPRTKIRELPRGILSVLEVRTFIFLSSAILVFSAYQINLLCFYLSPLALAIIFFYSYTKRFTSLTQFFLGLALSGAPIGAWIAVTGHFEPATFILGLAVLFWLAGFDTIYSCQDVEFDRSENLHSLPAKLGIKRALTAARFFHLMTFTFFVSLKFMLDLGYIYLIGVLIVGAILIYEHSLVKHDDLSKVDIAFFNMNAILSVIYFVFTLLDRFIPI